MHKDSPILRAYAIVRSSHDNSITCTVQCEVGVSILQKASSLKSLTCVFAFQRNLICRIAHATTLKWPFTYRPYYNYLSLIDSLFSRLMLVVLQVRLVLPDVTGDEHNSGQVKQGLTGSVLAVEVSSLVLAPRGGWLLRSWSWTSWQLLVEGDNFAHSLGVGSATNVLWVSITGCETLR